MWAQRMFRLSKGVTAGAAISMQLNSSAAVDCDDWKEHLVAAGTVIAGGALVYYATNSLSEDNHPLPAVNQPTLGPSYDSMQLLLGHKLQSASTTEDTMLWTKSNKNYIATASCPPKPLLCLYFSGHWCGPCRTFTPELAKCFQNGLSKYSDIVFISADRSEGAFEDYFSSMPGFLALPYEQRQTAQALGERFGVRGYPTLVVINRETGEVVSQSGRSEVYPDDPARTLRTWGVHKY